MYVPSALNPAASVVTDAHVYVIVKHLAQGGSEAGAAALARVRLDAWREWRAENMEFVAERVEEEREKLVAEGLERVRSAGQKDWRAAKTFLEIVAPERYGEGASAGAALAKAAMDMGLVERAMRVVYGEARTVAAGGRRQKEQRQVEDAAVVEPVVDYTPPPPPVVEIDPYYQLIG